MGVGYLQSKERYETTEEIEQTVQKPGTAASAGWNYSDWQSWGGGSVGQKTFDARRFPIPPDGPENRGKGCSFHDVHPTEYEQSV
ncbi:MAG: hypothetical protein ACLU6W_09955 [Lachnospiraceae bacterium]